MELGTFYKNVIASQIDGTDATLYGAYWNSLTELKALNDAKPDREIITLRIYREIASRVVEYVGYFKEDGVSGEEIAAMLNEIEEDLLKMEQGRRALPKKRLTQSAGLSTGHTRWYMPLTRRMRHPVRIRRVNRAKE